MAKSGVSRARQQAMFRRRRQSLVVAACAFMGSLGAVAGIMARHMPTPSFLGGKSLRHAETLLLVGVDDNYDAAGHRVKNEKARTDTVLVATLDPGHHTVHVLSIPRDTQVLIPGYGTDKINAARARGGIQATKDVVEALLGITVDHTVEVSLAGASDFLDKLGGVDVFVDKPMHYEDHTAKLLIDFKPGWQKLDGRSAVEFARFRHDALGDIGRVNRQQLLMHAVEQKLVNPMNLWRLPELGTAAGHLFKADLKPQDYVAITGFFKGHPTVSYTTLPGDFGSDGAWIPNHVRIVSLLDHLNAGTPAHKTKAGVPAMVEILYAPNMDQAAEKLAETMSQRGLTVVRSAPLPADENVNSRIIGRNGNPTLDPTLASLMPSAPWQLSDDESPYSADYTVVLGPDNR